jgi:hypothetical protein
LGAPVFDEGFLYRVKLLSVRQSFNGDNLLPLNLGREKQTGAHGRPIQQDRARAASPILAPALCPGQLKILPDDLQKGPVRSDFKNFNPSVYV